MLGRSSIAALAILAVFVVTAGAKPKARYGISPAAPRAGDTVTLDASRSTCRGCRYRWHLLRRGREEPIGSTKVLRRAFPAAGTYRVRLTVTARRGGSSRVVRRIRVRRAAAGPSPAPPRALGQPSCEAGATQASSAAQVRSAVAAESSVCVTKAVGNVDLSGLEGSTERAIGTTAGGSLGEIEIDESSRITLRARFEAVTIRRSRWITIEQSVVGGTSGARVDDQLIFIPEPSDDVTIRDNDIGWTTADDSGNTGFGIRAFEDSARLRIERNYLHHLGGDGIQLGMDGVDTLVDRNEIAYVAPPPSSSEHADDLQVVFNGPNMRITNNYMHHNGYLGAGGEQSGGSGPYIHAGTSNALLFENNLVRDAANFPQIGGLGTGGCERSNLTFRRNTFTRNGRMFNSSPDLEWSLCGGANNVYERNVVNDTFFNDHGFGTHTSARDNLHGRAYTIDDATGNCIVGACDPGGQEPIGFRKPSGVHW